MPSSTVADPSQPTAQMPQVASSAESVEAVTNSQSSTDFASCAQDGVDNAVITLDIMSSLQKMVDIHKVILAQKQNDLQQAMHAAARMATFRAISAIIFADVLLVMILTVGYGEDAAEQFQKAKDNASAIVDVAAERLTTITTTLAPAGPPDESARLREEISCTYATLTELWTELGMQNAAAVVASLRASDEEIARCDQRIRQAEAETAWYDAKDRYLKAIVASEEAGAPVGAPELDRLRSALTDSLVDFLMKGLIPKLADL